MSSTKLTQDSTIAEMREVIRINRDKIAETRIPTKKAEIWALIKKYKLNAPKAPVTPKKVIVTPKKVISTPRKSISSPRIPPPPEIIQPACELGNEDDFNKMYESACRRYPSNPNCVHKPPKIAIAPPVPVAEPRGFLADIRKGGVPLKPTGVKAKAVKPKADLGLFGALGQKFKGARGSSARSSAGRSTRRSTRRSTAVSSTWQD